MKTSIRISEHAELNRLAASVCLQSIRDVLYAKDPMRQLDAFLFVTSGDFPLWAEAGRLDFADPYKVLTNLRRAREILKTRRI